MKEGKEVKDTLMKLTLAFNGVAQRLRNCQCPVCRKTVWNIDPLVKYLMHYNLDENNKIDTNHTLGAPVITAICEECGYVMQFNTTYALNYIPDGKDLLFSEKQVRADNYKAIYPSEAEIAALEKQKREFDAELKRQDAEIARLKAEIAKRKHDE